MRGFPGGASGKEATCQSRRRKRHGFCSWVRKVPWRRAWPHTPVFFPGECHGLRSLLGYSPQYRKKRHDWNDLLRTCKPREGHAALYDVVCPTAVKVTLCPYHHMLLLDPSLRSTVFKGMELGDPSWDSKSVSEFADMNLHAAPAFLGLFCVLLIIPFILVAFSLFSFLRWGSLVLFVDFFFLF